MENLLQKVGSWMPVEVQKKMEVKKGDYIAWYIQEDGKIGIGKCTITVGS